MEKAGKKNLISRTIVEAMSAQKRILHPIPMKPRSLLRDLFLFFLVVILFVVVLGVMASYGVSLPIILVASFVFGLVLLLLLPRLLREDDPKKSDHSSSNFRF